MIAEDIYTARQQTFAHNRIMRLPTEIEVPPFSEWAEEERYIPEGVSDYYGPFDWSIAPHLKEILDCCHPDHPARKIAFMKSVQSAGTTSIGENAMGAFIKYKLGNVLFLTSTKGIGAIRGSANIDTLIDNSGLAGLLKPMSNRTGKKNKDNTFYKEFSGGIKLLITSYNSIGDLKSNTWHLIIRDEWEEAGVELKDQGDIDGIIEGRTRGLRFYKIVDISTSGRMETSRIYKSFMEGDQREFFAPCPECGEQQILILKGKGEDYGLTFTTEKNKKTEVREIIPDTVRYICKFCKDEFRENKKQYMMENGVWIPTGTAKVANKVSYHSGGLIAPEPFMSWFRICDDFKNTGFGQDVMKFKDFTINVLGNPWAAVKKAAKWEMLKERAENYTMGTVPEGEKVVISGLELYNGPMFLYAGADVQGDRIEILVVGFGINGNKWVVDHQVFFGNTGDINDPCWHNLENYVYTSKFQIMGNDAYIELCALDAGYNPRASKREKDYAGKAHIVYEFISVRTERFIAVMGDPSDKAIGIIKESRISDTHTSLTKRYMVSVSLLKEMIMNVIGNTDGFNCIHVPKWIKQAGIERELEVPDEFYQQFLSERYQEDPKKPGNYIWHKIRNRNEILDCFIYAIAGADFHGVNKFTLENWNTYYLGVV